jgi:hypothetical protein
VKLRILADHDVEGQVEAIIRICMSPEWADVWASLACRVDSFERLGLAKNTIDSEVWRLCQELGIVLVTGNRNADDDTSLEMTIRDHGTERSLPVITIGDSKRLLRDTDYARAATAKLLEYLFDLENIRGAGRLYIP